jgi:copper chaperone NosL
MRRHLPATLALLAALLAGCGEEGGTATAPPPPVALTREAVGHYCGMALAEHPGPKGQILLRGDSRPVWFSSARDTIAFTGLAEEARTIRAIYVSDMARAESWDQPGADNWVEARRAHFVLGSTRRGGMGAEEAIPFSDRAAAERFAAEHGGQVLAFAEIPRDWALGGGDDGAPAEPAEPQAAATAAPRHRH